MPWDLAQPMSGEQHVEPRAVYESEPDKKPARTTMTLTNDKLLRGTWPGVLLSGFGRLLRETKGGIGSIKESDDEYSKSFQVDELDIFLSHSWHAPWMMKYLVLLFHFNLKPALLVALIVAMFSFLYQRVGLEGVADTNAYSPTHFGEKYNPRAFCYSLLLSSAFFVLVLLGWHRVSVRLRCGRWHLDSTIFLDKVCIHQTDLSLKEAGIKSIGAILGKSRMVLVAWDPTYFERLWCTYELSAYQFARPSGRFMVLPVELGVFTSSATCISTGCVAARYFVHHDVAPEIVSACAFVPLLLLMSRIRNYLASLEALQEQLETFSVKKSRCFCCDHNHLHPETEEPMNCDRELVYESIAHWHGKDEDGANNRLEYGLQRFDALVRANLKRDMERTLGKWAQVPYPHALMISMPPFLQTLDWHVQCPLWWSMLSVFTQWLLRYPLCIAIILFIVSLFRTKQKWRLTETVIEVTLALLSVGIIGAMTVLGDHFVYREKWLPRLCWFTIEVLAIGMLYLRRDSVAVDRLKWAIHKVHEGTDQVGKIIHDLRPAETSDFRFAGSTSTPFFPMMSSLRLWQARSYGARFSESSSVELTDYQGGALTPPHAKINRGAANGFLKVGSSPTNRRSKKTVLHWDPVESSVPEGSGSVQAPNGKAKVAEAESSSNGMQSETLRGSAVRW